MSDRLSCVETFFSKIARSAIYVDTQLVFAKEIAIFLSDLETVSEKRESVFRTMAQSSVIAPLGFVLDGQIRV